MIILMKKRNLIYAGLLCCFFAGFTALMWAGHLRMPLPTFSGEEFGEEKQVLIDPGHGGEDGGAVSPDGVAESQINLEISLLVNDLLRFAGQKTQMVRTEDISVCDEGLSTIRERKASDLRNRVTMANEAESNVLLSIHQNSLPSSPVTHGAQVFWNQQQGAEELACIVQDSLNAAINQGNEKHPKAISDSIYLMKHAQVPGALVECGFLSNEEETLLLQDAAYQMKLAASITAGYLRWAAGEELPT